VVLVEMLVLVEELVEELVVLVEVELDVVELVELLVELVDVLVEVVGSGDIVPSFLTTIFARNEKGTCYLAQRKDRTFPIVGRFRNRRKRSRPANI